MNEQTNDTDLLLTKEDCSNVTGCLLATSTGFVANSVNSSEQNSTAALIDIAVAGAVPSSGAHLPSWVLQMRQKIADSRTAHDYAESRLQSLRADVRVLDGKLSAAGYAPTLPITGSAGYNRSALYTISTAEGSGTRGLCDGENGKEVVVVKASRQDRRSSYINSISPDVMFVIMKFLRLEEVLSLTTTSSLMEQLISTNYYWKWIYPIVFPSLLSDRDGNRKRTLRKADSKIPLSNFLCRERILSFFHQVNVSATFIESMKDQRSIPKHRSIQPHRHNKSEKSVTHPLPLFESKGSSTQTQGTSRSEIGERIMSRAETLSSDYRSYAHKSLDVLYELTSDVGSRINYRLINLGVITVLTSLLSNEEGAIQNYACGILANLFCWESRAELGEKIKSVGLAKKRDSPIHEKDSSEYPWNILVDLEDNTNIVSLTSQLEACNGHKLLISLLTSPSASINLAGNTARSSGGLKELRMTASVQGMSTKQASRALISMYFPSMPVPAISIASTAARSGGTRSSMISKSLDNMDTADKFRLSSKINFVKALRSASENMSHPQVISTDLFIDKSSAAIDCENDSFVTKTMLSASNTEEVPIHLAAPIISGIFISSEAQPWILTYFYKSGSMKDQFTTYLQFTPDGYLRGRGIDEIGTFYVVGKADPDITGWAWYFHKTYLRQDSTSLQGVESMDTWVANAAEPVDEVGRAPIHVSHVGYWSEGHGNIYKNQNDQTPTNFSSSW